MARVAKALFMFQAVAVIRASRIKHHSRGLEFTGEEVFAEKAGAGDNATISISFKSLGLGHHPNDVGRAVIKFVGEQAHLSNQGFARYPPSGWQSGALLGKGDDYVWPIASETNYGSLASASVFTFDHGVSDLVFGNAIASKGEAYTPEFQEIVYTRSGAGRLNDPQAAMRSQLREEQKESNLQFGAWNKDGYFCPSTRTGRDGMLECAHTNYGAQRAARMQYSPRLKLANPGQTRFEEVGRGVPYMKAVLERPHILDIDNLFSVKPLVPNSFRASGVVSGDPTYEGGYARHNGGYQGGSSASGYPAPGYSGSGHPAPGYLGSGQNTYGGQRPQPYGAHGFNTSILVPSRCYARKGKVNKAMEVLNLRCGRNVGEKCATQDECRQMNGRWKNKYCTGGAGCGCCKDIGRLPSLLQSDAESVQSSEEIGINQNRQPTGPMRPDRAAGPVGFNDNMPVQPHGSNAALPVEISVEWLTPVLQKFQCVSVAPQYAKTGASSLFIAMGWDTESGVQDLDLDLSLVPVNKYKRIIKEKMVWYNQQVPRALQNCGYNQHGMRAFNDDRSGDEPGDDELVKVNLGCISHIHTDIEAIVVMVNIYTPQQLTWNQIDSAYLRIISGGIEQKVSDNFFVRDADAVRSFVRLSGNDLHSDPELSTNGLAVGMFFRQRDNWAFASLQKAIPGRNVQQSGPHLEGLLNDLVYPANEFWDQTRDQQELAKQGAFGEAGIHGKATMTDQITGGQLPCVTSRKDQANLLLGHMNRNALQEVVTAPGVRQDVQQTAQRLLDNEQLAQKVQGIAQAATKMEKAQTDEERKNIANQIKDTAPVAPTEEESSAAIDDLKDLFDGI